ncbi:hypothetical protein COB55_01245 [Candidatus Wolfebacteria bacterium]|nr:MAG: hypothetical protein COB55_01245 [Candidatus Wolfebacteria bacterium]
MFALPSFYIICGSVCVCIAFFVYVVLAYGVRRDLEITGYPNEHTRLEYGPEFDEACRCLNDDVSKDEEYIGMTDRSELPENLKIRFYDEAFGFELFCCALCGTSIIMSFRLLFPGITF